MGKTFSWPPENLDDLHHRLFSEQQGPEQVQIILSQEAIDFIEADPVLGRAFAHLKLIPSSQAMLTPFGKIVVDETMPPDQIKIIPS